MYETSLESESVVLLCLADLLAVLALRLTDAIGHAQVALHVRVEDLQGVNSIMITFVGSFHFNKRLSLKHLCLLGMMGRNVIQGDNPGW